MATARFTATVVRPTPPFGLKTATTRPGSPAFTRSPVAATGGGDHRDGGHPALLVALASAHLADRRGQLVAAEGLDEELASACQHRSAEVVRLALDRHHDDRGARNGRGELLGGGDAVHVRHVDVHQHDVRAEPSRPSPGLHGRTRPSRPRRCRFRSRAASSGDLGSRGCRRRLGRGSGRPSRSGWSLMLCVCCDGSWEGEPRRAPDPTCRSDAPVAPCAKLAAGECD